jgi:hypothetical protein
MIKFIVIGLWASLVTVGADYATAHVEDSFAAHGSAAARPTVVNEKTKEINVPRIEHGDLVGYVVAQFSYDVDTAAAADAATPPDVLVVDQAYRYLYSNDSLDFSNLKKVDLSALTNAIETNVNERYKRNVISNVSIGELTLLNRGQTDNPF